MAGEGRDNGDLGLKGEKGFGTRGTRWQNRIKKSTEKGYRIIFKYSLWSRTERVTGVTECGRIYRKMVFKGRY